MEREREGERERERERERGSRFQIGNGLKRVKTPIKFCSFLSFVAFDEKLKKWRRSFWFGNIALLY